MSTPLRVLIVEDNPADAELVVRQLRGSGFAPDWHRVDTERDFRASVDGGFDVILSDYELPQFNGLRALRLLRERGLDIPFILISGTIGEDVAVTAMREGASDYLLKDRLGRLESAIHQALEQRRLRQERRRMEAHMATMSELGTRLSAARTARDAAEVIVEIADQLFGWDACVLDLYCREEDELIHVLNMDTVGGQRIEVPRPPSFPRVSAIAREIIEQGAKLVLKDPSVFLPGASPFGDVARPSASILYVPIRYGPTVTGLLGIHSYTVNAYGSDDLKALQSLADECGGALERIRAGEALRESEARYRALVETTCDWVWEVDAAGCYTYASPKVRDLLGYAPEEVVGRTPFDFMPEAEARRVAAAFAEIAAQRRPFAALENANLHKDGRVVVLESSGVPIFGPDGEYRGYRGTDRDITERKHVEDEMRRRLELQDQLARVAETVPGAIYSFRLRPDGAMSLPYTSPAFERIFNLKAEQVRDDATPGFAMIHPEDLGPVKATIAASARSLTPWRTEFRVCRGSAGEIWLEGHSVPQPEADGSILWHGFLHDVTERKRAEAQLRKLSRAVEQSPVLVVITDTAGAIEYVNPQFTKVTGYALDEVRGRNPRLLKSGQMPAEAYALLWRTILAGKDWRGEFHNRKKNGELYWESACISPIVDEAGRITHFLGIKEDVTGRKHLEEQLRQSQKMEAIGLLAGGVAHDFNNILGAALLNLGMLKEHPGLDEVVQDSVRELEACMGRAASLTRQLLLFSRRSVMDVRTLDVNEVVENMLKMLRRIIGENVKLDWQGRSGLPSVEADAGMLDQVIMNLAVNARDAMPKGGQLTLATDVVEVPAEQVPAESEAPPGRYVRLSVRDNDCGMAEATLKRIFEPFFTTKEAGKGTGLGLATVYGIVRQHRGWVEVESQVGIGSTFRVFLPALPEPAGRQKSVPESQPVAGGHETILLVEDDEPLRLMVSAYLRRLGYRVLLATDGVEGMAVWDQQQAGIDLLLTDMVMPEEMSGLDLAERLLSTRPDLKIIISSGYSAELVQQGGVPDKRITYLQKPYPPPTLAAAIRRCLDERAP